MPYVHNTLECLRKSSPAQTEFYQAAEEVLECLRPLFERYPEYLEHSIIERIVEPERQTPSVRISVATSDMLS